MTPSQSEATSGSRLPEPDGLASLARLAHELRTPLMAMGMTAELLSEDLDHLERPEVRQLLATFYRSTVWLHQLVENLHESAARGGEPGALACAPVDLRDVLHETERVLEPLLAAKAQRLAVLMPERLPSVHAERQRLGQVFLNLLGNASKFAPPETALRVTLSRTEAGVRAAVEDRGPGFAASAKVRLFDPFYQAPTPTAAERRGVGLGLAIVKDIIEAHGGRVGAENRRGGGARVWFELAQDPAVSTANAPLPIGRAELGRRGLGNDDICRPRRSGHR